MPDMQASLVNNYIDDHMQFLVNLEVLEALVHNVHVVPPPAPKICRNVHFSHLRESCNPSDDGLLHYRPSALVPNDVLPRESLANESDLVWESHCAVNDTSE